jgi:hypothetical protein
MPDALTGGCTCGAVRYRLATPPMFVNCCHCTECQRQTGSAFVINAVMETDRIAVTAGTPAAIATPTTSGNPHDIYRCPTCQIALWSDYGRRPNLRFVRVATLDNPAALPPDAHIFTSTALPWVIIPPATPAFAEYYDMKTQWPAESLARRRAATG